MHLDILFMMIIVSFILYFTCIFLFLIIFFLFFYLDIDCPSNYVFSWTHTHSRNTLYFLLKCFKVCQERRKVGESCIKLFKASYKLFIASYRLIFGALQLPRQAEIAGRPLLYSRKNRICKLNKF